MHTMHDQQQKSRILQLFCLVKFSLCHWPLNVKTKDFNLGQQLTDKLTELTDLETELNKFNLTLISIQKISLNAQFV